MPYYEFECDHCGFVIEKFFKSADLGDDTHMFKLCEQEGCLSASYKKILSVTNFKLEGMGWGVDGYDKNAAPRVRELDEPSVI
ncbi:unnamed protein product [marine sediment metagenome]|uniref:Putative regulatory protein FmdB zinc ribbon domain-containing protein n=1 Tax=marine sediment metagenome TaxID=412755 RepID=X0T1Y0_9ZZZZ